MAYNLKVAPDTLILHKGEVKNIQLTYDIYDGEFSYKVDPANLFHFDLNTREVTGLNAGYGSLTIYLTYIDDITKQEITTSDTTMVRVSEEEVTDTPVRIMLHNRATNRLVTVQGDLNAVEDLNFKLPKGDGTLLIDSNYSSLLTGIEQPTITNVPDGVGVNWSGEFIGSPFIYKLGGKDFKHTATTWEFATDKDFNNIIRRITHTTGDLTRCGQELFGLTVYIRFKYISNEVESPWSEPFQVQLTNKVSADNLYTPVVGNDIWKGIYYGKIEGSSCVDNYDYRGNFQTLWDNNCKRFYAGQQVIYDGQLWYATANMDSTNIVIPGSRDVANNRWQLDDRENLPTGKLLMEMVGLAGGSPAGDLNKDGWSTGKTHINSPRVEAGAWLKFNYEGKIIYVYERPLIDSEPAKELNDSQKNNRGICWNDLAKREVAYADRTFRFGTRLYRLRMLREDEIKALFIDLAYKQPLLNTSINPWNNELVQCWEEGATRRCINVNENGDITFGYIDPKSRTAAWRPVLELIPYGSEPWRHWDAGVEALDEELEYDPWTDTGYFGRVPCNKFLNGMECRTISQINGTSYNQAVDWLKFYWHGQILYWPMKSLTYGITYLNLQDRKLVHNCCMGGGRSDYLATSIDGKEYRFALPMCSRWYPIRCSDNGWSNTDGGSFTDSTAIKNISLDQAKWSHQGELLYRVQRGFVDDGNSADENSVTKVVQRYGNYNWRRYHGGVQIGDNFKRTDFHESDDLGFAYNASGTGYGACRIAREHAYYTAGSTSGERPNCMFYGVQVWEYDSVTETDSHRGWAPMVKLHVNQGERIYRKEEQFVSKTFATNK